MKNDIDLEDKVVKFSKVEISPKRGLSLSFILGFSIRLIPELLSYPYSIGFDTVYHAATLKECVMWYHWTDIFTQSWLLYGLLIPVYKISGLNPMIILKIAASTLYGLNVVGIYYFADKNLGWKPKKSFLSSILFSFNIASLRISWDLYRNMLGLAVLLFATSTLSEAESGKKMPHFAVLSILTTLSHELATVTLLAISSWIILNDVRKREKEKALRLLTSIFPTLILFSIKIYLTAYPISYSIETNIIDIGDSDYAYLPGLFFLTNYLKVATPSEQYGTYIELAIHVVSLFSLLYLIWIPLIIKGFFKERILGIWTALLLIICLDALIMPYSAVLLWERWMIMLVYPFTFYATNGLENILNESKPRKAWRGISRTITVVTVLMGVSFMALPTDFAAYGIPTTLPYFPSTMQQNTIPVEDVKGTIESLEYLNGKMNQNSCVLVHHTFLSWAILYLDKKHTIIYYTMNLTKAVEVAEQNGFKEIYLVWWSRHMGWYPNMEVPENFETVYSYGRISTYGWKAF